MIQLTAQERTKFAQYLQEQVDSNKILIEEMKKLGDSMKPIVENYNARILAYTIVSRDLTATTTEKL